MLLAFGRPGVFGTMCENELLRPNEIIVRCVLLDFLFGCLLHAFFFKALVDS